MQQLTVKLRLRDKHAAELNRQARAVNRVWNDCNEAQRHVFETRWACKEKWLTYRGLARATAGAGVELNLHSHTVQRVCKEYVNPANNRRSGGSASVTATLSTVRRSVSIASDTSRCTCAMFFRPTSRLEPEASTMTLAADGTSIFQSSWNVPARRLISGSASTSA